MPPDAPQTKRWRYVIPNAITLGSMLVGLGSMGQAVTGHYEDAAWLIIMCAMLDKLDGTAARLLGASSKIGSQLDSFSDFVAFGVAPATLIFTWIRGIPPDSGLGPFAWWHPDWNSYLLHFLCAFYVICATIRLAKFNVLEDTARDVTGTPVFYGIPTTIVGSLIAATCLVGLKYEWFDLINALPFTLIFFGAVMILNFPFPRLSKRPWLISNIFLVVNVFMAYLTGLFRIWPEYLFGSISFFFFFGMVWSAAYHKTLEAPPNLDPYPQ
jgi:CDP-diacylglycerol---serine O-phosphatidyltransferase